MSQYPYQDPGQYNPNLSYGTPQGAPQRPAAVTGLAITGIVLGSLGLLCNVVNMFSSVMMLGTGGRNPFMPAGITMTMDPWIARVALGEAVVGVLFCAVLLGGCIAAMKLVRAARITMFVWSFATIAWAIIVTVIKIVWIIPATNAFMAKAMPSNPMVSSGMMNSIQIPMAIVTGAVYCIIPVLFLTLWNRQNVKAAFGVPGAMPPQGQMM